MKKSGQIVSQKSNQTVGKLKATAMVRLFGLAKIPLIYFCRPKVLKLNTIEIESVIPLRRRTKNHLNSMYFGALSIGADLSGGILAGHIIQLSGEKINLVFKDFNAKFLKRAEGDVHFHCGDGKAIQSLVYQAIKTGERQNYPLSVLATVPAKFGNEPVAEMTLTLSIKKGGKP